MMCLKQNVKIGTWNACLGKSNKKDLIAQMINDNKIGVLLNILQYVNNEST